MNIEEQVRMIRSAHISRDFHNWLSYRESLNSSRVDLGELVDMNIGRDREEVGRWLLANMDSVMHELNRNQNFHIGYAILHGILTESKDIELAVRFLEDAA